MFSIPTPNDLHVHFRQGDMLPSLLRATKRSFRHATVMPNTSPPCDTEDRVREYLKNVRAAIPADSVFVPRMTLFLSGNTQPMDVDRLADDEDIAFAGVKAYPPAKDATTNTEGAIDVTEAPSVLRAMERLDVPLLIHGEMPDADVFDRERVYLQERLGWLREKFPTLRIVLEHVTTSEAVQAVRDDPDGLLAATVTPQHLLLDRNDMLGGKLQPHMFCKPILKRREDLQSIRSAVVHEGHPRFMAGTDSAPHPVRAKEAQECCAGCFTAMHAIELYAEAFDAGAAAFEESLDDPEVQRRFQAFMHDNGVAFHGLQPSDTKVTLERVEKANHRVSDTVFIGEASLKGMLVSPLFAGKALSWDIWRLTSFLQPSE